MAAQLLLRARQVEEEAPLDGFQETALQRKENMTKNIGFPRDVMEGKEFNELKLGGGRKNEKLKQFLENDRKARSQSRTLSQYPHPLCAER